MLKEAQDSRWLKAEQMNDVKWLPGDLGLIEIVRKELMKSEREKRK